MPQVGLHEDSKSDFPGPDRNENFIEIVDGEPVIFCLGAGRIGKIRIEGV